MTRLGRRVMTFVIDARALTGTVPAGAEIARQLGVSGAAISQVLVQLEKAGLVTRRDRKQGGVVVHWTPGAGGLLAAELAWCNANAGRVRAMIALDLEMRGQP